MHWTHTFGDKVSGKSEYKNQSEVFLADLIPASSIRVILSLDLKVNIQDAKRVPQLLMQNSGSRNNQKQRQHFIFWMKPPAQLWRDRFRIRSRIVVASANWPARRAIAPTSALRALNREFILRASDREVNPPEKTHLEVVRHVAAVRPTPRRRIDVRAVI
jgi:hypothetical protein